MTAWHRRSLAVLCAAAALGLGAGAAEAATPVHLTLTGVSQGAILGGSVRVGRVGTIEAHEIHHLIHRDPVSGPTTHHEPFIFTKELDRSTVNLYRAWDTGEMLTAVFRYYTTDQQGMEINSYTVTLFNARVVAIEPITRDILDPASVNFPHRERVRMIYGRILYEYPADGESQEITPTTGPS